MTKEIFSISMVKLLSVVVAFFLPMVVARQYDLFDYGTFNYLTAMMVYVSIFQCGITPTLRNSLSKLNESDDATNTISFSIQQTLAWVVLLVFLSFLCFLYFQFDVEYYAFILATIFTLFSPVIATYFDYRMESIRYKLGEFACQVVITAIVITMCIVEMHVALVASVMISYRTVYALYKCFSKNLLPVTEINFGFRGLYKYFNLGSGNGNYILLQIFSVASIILLTVYAESFLGIEEYGVYSTYYKFFFFPIQIFAFVAPVIWMRYAQYKAGTQDLTGVSYFFTLLLSAISLWVFLMVFFVDWLVDVYMGIEVSLEISILLLALLYLCFQLSDFISVFLNAEGNFGIQATLSAVVFVFLLFLFYWDVPFNNALLYFSLAKLTTVLIMSFYWRKV